MTDYPYKVYTTDGRLVLQAAETCRYNKQTERQLLEGGYTIKLNGKRVTKKDLNMREE